MPQIARLGDESDHGGKIVQVSGHYLVSGKLIALEGDMHDCPQKGHGLTPLISGSIVLCLGKKIIRIGDRAECGAKIITGDPTTDSD